MIRLKNILKAFGGAIVTFCAVFIIYLFQSFALDLKKIDISKLSVAQKELYDAQIIQSNMMLGIACGIIGLFAVVTLFFSISKYISENQANMGILKAIGYERKRISFEFTKFSLIAFIGSVIGIIIGIIFQPIFYKEMTKDGVLPKINSTFNIGFILIVLILPALVFGIASYIIAYCKLYRAPLDMIKGIKNSKSKKLKEKATFLKTLKSAILKKHISLIIFVGFSSLCFGSAVQMSFSVNQLGTSGFLFWMMLGIGLLLGISILYLAFNFAYNGNKEYLSLMKAYGYSDKEIIQSLYGGYIPVTIIGFIVGTVYQYGLMHLMISIFSETITMTYTFSYKGLLYTLLIFVPIYLFLNCYFYTKLKKISIRNALLSE